MDEEQSSGESIQSSEPVEPVSHSEPVENQEQASEPQSDKPEGWEQVNFTPEQQQRFDRVYKQTKELQRTVTDYRKIAKEQSQVIARLEQGQQQIVSHIQNDDYSKTENQIKASRDEAFNRGDLAAFNAANDKLIEINTRKNIESILNKNQPQPQQPQYGQPVSGQDVINEAIEEGNITHDDASSYQRWANETDSYGNLKRPWVNQGDMRNKLAAVEGTAVFKNPAFKNKTFAEKLKEIDRRMGIQERTASQSVLPSGRNLTPGKQASNIKLSPSIEKVAVRSQFAGRGKSDAEHIEAYKQQLVKAKGSRK